MKDTFLLGLGHVGANKSAVEFTMYSTAIYSRKTVISILFHVVWCFYLFVCEESLTKQK